jgi:predicted metal-dependent enzyme (double-stranded beta helix superfamily)
MATTLGTTDIHPAPPQTVPGPRAAIRRLASTLCALADALHENELAPAVAEALRPWLGHTGLLHPDQMLGARRTYRRHVLYADPLRRFTILALVWKAGQHTPVHGHTAWGAVGVHCGRLETRNYELIDTGGGLLACSETLYCEAVAGATAWVAPGLQDIHRLACNAPDGAVSIHVYGRDLTRDPGSINIALPH